MIDSFSLKARELVEGRGFQRCVIGVILFSAALLGLETSPHLMDRYGGIFKIIDRIVLSLFVLEIVLKIIAQGSTPLRYFKDGWNVIDFAIVAACLIPASSNAAAVFRLIRILRVLRLVTALPKLQTIITALFRSIPSMGYVVGLLFIHFYMYGVLGTFLFGQNDPVHFGNIGKSFLSLFQILTLEGWADLMRIQTYGCASFGYEAFSSLCVKTAAQPIAAPIFFITFIVVGTMIILNLLIGVVVSGMATPAKESEIRDLNASHPPLSEVLAEIQILRREIGELRNRGN